MALTTQEFCNYFPKITEHINDNEVSALISRLKYSSIGENKQILHDNQSNDYLYFVMDGQLDCYIEDNGNKISIGKITPGEYVGEVSMLDGLPATSSVMTETRCTLYTLSRDSFKELEKQYPAISGKLLRSVSSILINRLRSADSLLFDGLANHQDSEMAEGENNNEITHEWLVKIYQLLHRH